MGRLTNHFYERALDVADHHPSITVHAVDLHPPPQPLTAPNCIFEIDDLSQVVIRL